MFYFNIFYLQAFSGAEDHCSEELVLGYIIILMYRCNYCTKNVSK